MSSLKEAEQAVLASGMPQNVLDEEVARFLRSVPAGRDPLECAVLLYGGARALASIHNDRRLATVWRYRFVLAASMACNAAWLYSFWRWA